MRSKSRKTKASKAHLVVRQLSELSRLAPEVVARRSARVARLGLWSTRSGRSEMNQMIAEKAIATTQSGVAMWMETMAGVQKFWLSALGSSFFPGGTNKVALQSPLSIGIDAMARGLEPFRRKTSSNAKRLRRLR